MFLLIFGILLSNILNAQNNNASKKNSSSNAFNVQKKTSKNILIDKRDKHKYKIKEINNQIWMTENLDFANYNSYCYNNNIENCKLFGRLYTWTSAQSACPEGWRLPSKSDFEDLLKFISPNNNWNRVEALSGGSSGFDIKYCGMCDVDQMGRIACWDAGESFYLWTSTSNGSREAYFMGGSSKTNDMIDFAPYTTDGYTFSVRCIKR